MIDQETIRRLFVYEPDGRMRRIGGLKDYPWRGIGKDRRYLAHTLPDRSLIYLHQAVWLYHHGVIPPMLDHRNLNTQDCRIENLRLCTNAQNQYNARKKSNNRSGFKGVAHTPDRRQPWRARIIVDKKVIELGQFDTPEAASCAYAAAAARYAGEFARA